MKTNNKSYYNNVQLIFQGTYILKYLFASRSLLFYILKIKQVSLFSKKTSDTTITPSIANNCIIIRTRILMVLRTKIRGRKKYLCYIDRST